MRTKIEELKKEIQNLGNRVWKIENPFKYKVGDQVVILDEDSLGELTHPKNPVIYTVISMYYDEFRSDVHRTYKLKDSNGYVNQRYEDYICSLDEYRKHVSIPNPQKFNDI